MRSSALRSAGPALALLAACGGGEPAGDGGAACSEPGTAEVTGTVEESDVAPVSAASYYELATQDGLYALDINGPGATCGLAATEGEPAHRLALLFCEPVETGEYTIVPGSSFPDPPCPGERVALALVDDAFSGEDVDSSVSGHVDFETTGDCLTGTFDVAFTGGDTLFGSFHAFACSP